MTDPGDELQAAWEEVARILAEQAEAKRPPSAPTCSRCGRTVGATWAGLCQRCEHELGYFPDGFGGSIAREDVLDVMEWLVGQRTAPPLSDRRTTW